MWTDKMLRPGGPRFLVEQSKEIDWDLSQQKCARCTPFEGVFFFKLKRGKERESDDLILQIDVCSFLQPLPVSCPYFYCWFWALPWSWLGCHQLQTHWGLGGFRKQNEQVSCVYMPHHGVVYSCNHSWVLKWYLQGAGLWNRHQLTLFGALPHRLLHENK